ncbi:MAG TPA: T9SS type A sorting domain-containing protein, partial [Bacteroidetes bacterium]|nr:T9SS type A sorting domain-containing protein [Bacteroidota bacterium]HEX04139.1 T9SS type A sorting domain-containing protein [Bacteroidota bacterium]
GTTPWTLVDEDSFEFIKLGAITSDEQISWTSGDWFAEGDGNVETQSSLPSEFGLNSVYPNPFNPTTSLTLNLPDANTVNVIVFDMLGRQVAELVNGTMQAGSHTLTFDGTNHASGVYFVQAEMAGQTSIQKIVLMK